MNRISKWTATTGPAALLSRQCLQAPVYRRSSVLTSARGILGGVCAHRMMLLNFWWVLKYKLYEMSVDLFNSVLNSSFTSKINHLCHNKRHRTKWMRLVFIEIDTLYDFIHRIKSVHRLLLFKIWPCDQSCLTLKTSLSCNSVVFTDFRLMLTRLLEICQKAQEVPEVTLTGKKLIKSWGRHEYERSVRGYP